jgi:hypothetical protein
MSASKKLFSELPALHYLTELPLTLRFRVRMVSSCLITSDNGDSHFQLQIGLCVSINKLATHYTSVLEYPSYGMIAYFHVVMK